jgi:predicted DCC family thiol-disulfide oxidoreductase YuxK
LLKWLFYARRFSVVQEREMRVIDPRDAGSAAPVSGNLTVYYDGDCPLCRAEIGLYRGCTGAGDIRFLDVALADGDLVAPDLNKRAALARFHVRRADGTLVSGAAGFATLWQALPGWRRLGRIVMLPLVRPTAELVYRAFLIFRPGIQRLWRRRLQQA